MINQRGAENPPEFLTLEEIKKRYPPKEKYFDFLNQSPPHKKRRVSAVVSLDENGLIRYVVPKSAREIKLEENF